MTTDAERECYYRLAKEAAGKGAIIELGAWLGASTAYIAAGIRDSGIDTRVHVYDKFQSKPAHEAKVLAFYEREGIGSIPTGYARQAFDDYLGPLTRYVEVHEGQIETLISSRAPVALLIADAPKRGKAISAVLGRLRNAINPGAIMAWQDFGHFPSFEIPACLYRLKDRIEFVDYIVPGTTAVFRVTSAWSAAEVSLDRLSMNRWTPAEIEQAWSFWLEKVPDEKKALFRCGRAMFLCDIGHKTEAVACLSDVLDGHVGEVLPKWKYLHDGRPDLVDRYKPLFALLKADHLL